MRCDKDKDGFNILEVGKTVLFDGDEYLILDIGPRAKFEPNSNSVLLGRGIVARSIKSGDREYFLEHDLV